MKRSAFFFSICFAFGLLCLWPLLNAGLRTDDWSWLALAHLLDNPLSTYWHNVGWGYFYRPSTNVLWWLSERLAGDNSTWHYLIDIILHSASACCLALLLHAAKRPTWLALGVGLAYVCCPAIAGTSFWLSSRNEMLALLTGLCAMLFLEREIGRQNPRGFVTGIFLFVACTAKESAYLFPVACALRVFMDSGVANTLDRKSALRIVGLLFLPLLVSMSLRSMIIMPIGPEADPGSLFETLQAGITHWLRLWPSAIAGFNAGPIFWLYFAALAALALLASISARNSAKFRGWTMAALFLALVPAAIQAPIVSTVLNQSIAGTLPENLRFFATSGLGVLLLIGMCLPHERFKSLSMAGISVLIIIGSMSCFNMASRWRDATQADDRQARWLAAKIPVAMRTTQCGILSRVMIKADISPGIAPWIDPLLKAQWPRESNLQDCGFFVATQAAYYQILPREQCDTALWPEATSAQFRSQAKLLPLDSVCQIAMMPPDETSASAIIRLQDRDR